MDLQYDYRRKLLIYSSARCTTPESWLLVSFCKIILLINKLSKLEKRACRLSRKYYERPTNTPTCVRNIPTRVSNILTHVSNIPARDSNIPIRVSNIPTRDSNIPIRVSNIITRVSNIITRVTNITTRVSYTLMSVSSIFIIMKDIFDSILRFYWNTKKPFKIRFNCRTTRNSGCFIIIRGYATITLIFHTPHTETILFICV